MCKFNKCRKNLKLTALRFILTFYLKSHIFEDNYLLSANFVEFNYFYLDANEDTYSKNYT